MESIKQRSQLTKESGTKRCLRFFCVKKYQNFLNQFLIYSKHISSKNLINNNTIPIFTNMQYLNVSSNECTRIGKVKILDGLIRKYSEIQIDKTNATIKIFLCNCIFYLTLSCFTTLNTNHQFYIAWFILFLLFLTGYFLVLTPSSYTNFKIIQVCFSNYFYGIIIKLEW